MDRSFPPLAFPDAALRIRQTPDGRDVLDPVRRRWVRLTPEEWVRQHLVAYLITLGYPRSLLAIEREVRYLREARRADVLAVGRDQQPLLMAECKAATVPVDQATFDQAARYNSVIRARFAVVTNGLEHFCCHVDHMQQRYTFLEAVPSFAEAQEA